MSSFTHCGAVTACEFDQPHILCINLSLALLLLFILIVIVVLIIITLVIIDVSKIKQ